MKKNRSNRAVSEIVCVSILLGISISLFSIVQLIVFSYPFEPSPPSVNLVGSIDQGKLLIEHHGGESISLDVKILFSIGNLDMLSINATDYIDNATSDSDDKWEIGEKISYIPKDVTGYTIDLTGLFIRATVVDKETNSIIMNGIIQEGSS